MNLSEFQWHVVEPEMQLRQGGLRGRLFARVVHSGGTWRAVIGLHEAVAQVRSYGEESAAIESVEAWLDGWLQGDDSQRLLRMSALAKNGGTARLSP